MELFQCQTCDYKTPRKYHLTRHEKIHAVKKIPKIHKCEFCGYETKKLSHYKRHMLRCKQNPNNQKDIQPTKKPTLTCPRCDYKTDRPNKMRKHERQCLKLYKALGLDQPQVDMDIPDFQPIPLSENFDVLETIIPQLDPAIRQMYIDNFPSIRTQFKEPRKDSLINHAFYNIRWTQQQDWKATLDTIFRRQQKRFKISHAHSFILHNKIHDTYRFFHASRHVGKVQAVPKTINNYTDFQEYMKDINKEDMFEWAKSYRPDSDWTVAALTSTTFFVDRLKNFPIGLPLVEGSQQKLFDDLVPEESEDDGEDHLDFF